MKEPMKVAQLIDRLQQLAPDLLVMVECEDHYYNGPLVEELEFGIVARVGAHSLTTDDPFGRRKLYHVPERWLFESDAKFFGFEGHVVERKPCIIFRSGKATDTGNRFGSPPIDDLPGESR